MSSARLLLGGAAAGAALGVRVSRSLYGRWRILPAPDRERIADLAEHAKHTALALRGEADRAGAEAELRAANEVLAAALIETAEADPQVSADEVGELRADLRRELERIAGAEVKASRIPRETELPPE
jgi:hypothetical protein